MKESQCHEHAGDAIQSPASAGARLEGTRDSKTRMSAFYILRI